MSPFVKEQRRTLYKEGIRSKEDENKALGNPPKKGRKRAGGRQTKNVL
jgi:hypothetical protein